MDNLHLNFIKKWSRQTRPLHTLDNDEDNLSYSWSFVNEVSDELAGFTYTGNGEAEIYLRKAGLTVIKVTISDGSEETFSEEINLSMPLPPSSEIDADIISQEAEGTSFQRVIGRVYSPVLPFIIINGVKQECTYDESNRYLFSAKNVPLINYSTDINIKIYTYYNDDSLLLSESYIDGEESKLGLELSSGVGCTLNCIEKIEKCHTLYELFIFITLSLLIIRIYKSFIKIS